MDNYIVLLFMLVLLILLFTGPLYFRYMNKLINYMREHHNQIWESLDKPTLFTNNSIRTMSLMLNYLIKKKYMGSQDSSFILLANKTRRLLFISFTMGALLIVSGFVLGN